MNLVPSCLGPARPETAGRVVRGCEGCRVGQRSDVDREDDMVAHGAFLVRFPDITTNFEFGNAGAS